MHSTSSQTPTWLRARPLRQPIVGHRKSVLSCVTPTPLNLPAVCCRCGKPTDKTRTVRVVESPVGQVALTGAELVAGHFGHIVAGIHLLTQQKISVPGCPGCWSWHRRGMAAGLAIIAIAAGLFIGFASLDRDVKLRMPVWVTFAVVVGALILVLIGGIVSALFTWHATSVLVYRAREGGLYYEFWSPDYQEYLKVGANDEKRESA